MTVKAFLESLARPQKKHILRLVTGNQSADMDSVISAIAYSYFHHQKYPKEEPLLPLVNISRDEFRLRKDIVLLLGKHDISSTRLFFLDDVETFIKESPQATLDVVLVDHCNVQGELLTELHEQQKLNVSGIIDHHADENVFLDASPRFIQSTGSCSALVFNYWNSLIGPVNDTGVALLLLGPLLIDTSNMQQKVEENDRIAHAEYTRILAGSEGTFSIESQDDSHKSDVFSGLFSELKGAKKDLKGLLVLDILRKDYKQFKFQSRLRGTISVGFSSIGKSLSWVLTKYSVSDILHALQQITGTLHLDIVVITSSFKQKESGTYTREFCFSTHNAELEKLASFATDLDLSERFYQRELVAEALVQINKSVFFKVLNQRNTAASRKQVVPVVKQVIESNL